MDYRSLADKKDDAPQPTEKKEIVPVAKGEIVKKRHSKLTEVFLVPDLKDSFSIFTKEKLLPGLKNFVYGLIQDAISTAFYGSSSAPSRTTRINYNGISSGKSTPAPRPAGSRTREIDDLFYKSRGDAELVLDQLEDIIDRYHVLTVIDYYETGGQPVSDYTLNKYGWTSLRSAKIQAYREGWLIHMPPAIPLD